MKRLFVVAVLGGLGWWYFQQPEEPEDRISRIVIHDSATGEDNVVWERE